MAKELAQTVGGKRIAWLLAILAAFAVFATLGNNVGRQASAEVGSPVDVTCDDYTITSGSEIDCETDADTNQNSGDFRVITTLPTGTVIDEDASSCDDGDKTVAGNSVECLNTDPSSGNTETARAIGTATAQDNCSGGSTVEVQGSAIDSSPDEESDVVSVDIEVPCLSVDKWVEVNGSFCDLPCSGSYFISLSDSNPDADGESIWFSDELDDRLYINSVTPSDVCSFTNNPPVVSCGNDPNSSDDDANDVLSADNYTVIQINWTMSNSDIPLSDDLGDRVENDLSEVCSSAITDCLSDTVDDTDDDDLGGECGANLISQIPQVGAVDDATFCFSGQVGVQLTKEASTSPVSSEPQGTFSWMIQIINTGNVPLTHMTLDDLQLDGGSGKLDATGEVFVSGSFDGACVVTPNTAGDDKLECDFDNGNAPIDQLNPGESITVVVTMVTNSTAVDGNAIGNDVTFDADELTEPITSHGSVAIDNQPIIRITKVANSATVGYANGGPSTSFTVTVFNDGGVAANGVVIADVLPAGLVGTATACNTTVNIAANSSFTCQVTGVNLDPNTVIADGSSLINTATATYNEATYHASALVSAVVPHVVITKSALVATATAGQTGVVAFKITVSNDGSAGTGNFTLKDFVPAGLTVTSVTAVTGPACTAGNLTGAGCTISLAAGAAAEYNLTVSVAADVDDQTVLSNVACITDPAGAPELGEDLCDDAQIKIDAAKLAITKTDSPTLVGENQTVTSTIVVKNNGSATVNNVDVIVDLDDTTTFIATGSTNSCSVTNNAQEIVTCNTSVNLDFGDSFTITVKFNAGAGSVAGTIKTNVATTTNASSVDDATATAFITVIEGPVGGLVHVDVDAAAESAWHGLTSTDPNQVLHSAQNETSAALRDDNDDSIGSLHMVCLASSDLGTNDNENITWSIQNTPGSNATVSPVGGTKVAGVVLHEDNPATAGNSHDGAYDDHDANCVTWRSAGPGGQTITATHSITGAIYYLAGTTDTPIVKEWNVLTGTKIVETTGNVGYNTLFDNTQNVGGSTQAWLARDTTAWKAADVQNTEFTIAGSQIVIGSNAGKLLAGNKTFIEYALGTHSVEGAANYYNGPIDGVKQKFTLEGTCGSARVENSVTGSTSILEDAGDNATTLNSDKGVAFQIFPTDDATSAVLSNADCRAGDWTRIRISSSYDVVLDSGNPTFADEIVTIRWVTAPPPQKQVFLAWAGQRVILEHDWRLGPVSSNNQAGAAWDVTDGEDGGPVADPASGVTCGIGAEGAFLVHHVRGSGPGNFLPALGAQIQGNDDAQVLVSNGNVNQQQDYNNIQNPERACISRVVYESEDQGQVDIEAFVDGAFALNLTKVAFVIYYMKIESIDLSITTESKPNHNAPAKTFGAAYPYDNGDYAPGNPWDVSKDDADDTVDANVSKDVLVRGRVKGWFVNSNPSGRAADSSNALNVLPANRWVMPDDWDLLAGGPHGEEVKGTAETFRPDYDLMMAPNNTGLGTGVAFLCDSPFGACSETLMDNPATVAVDLVLQTYGIPGPIQGPFSLLDLRGPLSAAISSIPNNTIRNTIIRDGDVDWWDAPMPAAVVSVDLRESGFLKQVRKQDVYWVGNVNGNYGSATAGAGGQDFTNPFYVSNIPDSAFIPAVQAGGGYFWDTWGLDGSGPAGMGPYEFWTAVPQFLGNNINAGEARSANVNHGLVADPTLTAAERSELGQIRIAYGSASTDPITASEAGSIGRALVVYTDNHGEFMVQANGDFKLTYADCATNVFGGGKHCAQGNKVGGSTINATVDYPDFRGKHFPVKSNDVKINWTWGGYKEVTIEPGEVDQFKYVVFRALDRDGYCSGTGINGEVLLHPVLSSIDELFFVGGTSASKDPVETVDFIIDSGEGIIVGTSSGLGVVNKSGNRQFAEGLRTYSTALNDPAVSGIKEFTPVNGSTDECQSWIRVSNSLLGILDVLVTAYDDEGTIGFDRIVDFSSKLDYQLTFRWSLITWAGKDGISPTDALKGTVGTGANNIFDKVTAVYGWNQSAQTWGGFFPAGVSVPGANDLTALKNGSAYWVAIKGPDAVTWTIGTNID